MNPSSRYTPACFRLVESLKHSILASYKPGQRLAPLRTLAEQHGVSAATMSQALMILAFNGWIQPIHGSGFYVRDRDAAQHVAVLLELDIGLTSTSRFWPQVAQAVRQGLRERGIRNRLYAGHSRPHSEGGEVPCPDLVEDVEADRIGGVLITWGSDHDTWAAPLRERGIPVIGRYPGGGRRVHLDHERFVREAVQRLVDQGRERIGAIFWAPIGTDDPTDNPITNAFAAELARQGLRYNPAWVRWDLHPAVEGSGWEEFREIWASPDSEKPDGLIITDDMLLQGAATAIRQLGVKVPDDLKIMAQVGKGVEHHLPIPAEVATADPQQVADAMVELFMEQWEGRSSESRSRVIPLPWVESPVTSSLTPARHDAPETAE